MNIFGKVTTKTMKQNKVRTIVTIIGIILSTAMFTAVTTFASSLIDFMYKTDIYNDGNYQLSGIDVDYDKYTELEGDKRVADIATAEILGYGDIQSSNEDKPYLYIMAGDDNCFDMLPIHLIDGKMPENNNEIIIPSHLYTNGDVKYNIGDSLKIELGKRYTDETKEYTLNQFNSYNIDEVLITETQKTFTVVGIYDRPGFEHFSAPGYTAITYSNEINQQSTLEVYFNVNNPTKNLDNVVKDILPDANYNWDIIAYSGMSQYSNITVTLWMMAGIFIAIIMVGSVMLIYSTFSISVSERTKQFGLLSSVGATKKQIRKAVFYEAGVVSIIGIPIGVLCGVLGIGATLWLLSDKFKSILTSPFSVELKVETYSIIIAIAVAFLTIIISAIIPSIRATRISAIDAIRQKNDVKINKRKNKKYRLTYKVFKLEGVLANKYFSRSKKKYRTTIFSLAISIILFISTSTYCAYLNSMVSDNIYSYNYDLSYSCYKNEMSDSIFEKLKGAEGLEQICGMSYKNGELKTDKKQMSESFNDFVDEGSKINGYSEDDLSSVDVVLVYLDDDYYKEYIAELGINDKEYTNLNNSPALYYNNGKRILYYDNDRYTYKYDYLNDSVSEISVEAYGEYNDDNDEKKTSNYELGKKVTKLPMPLSDNTNSLCIIYPMSSADEDIQFNSIYFKASNQEKLVDSVKGILEDNQMPVSDSYLIDINARQQENQNLLTIINVFSYGFITLISLICVANVFNTISTNIALRRKDFAMLRSIGLTNKGINRMMAYECVLYGLRAMIFGLPLALVFSYLIWNSVSTAGEMEYYFPLAPIGVAVSCVFLVVSLSMIYAIRKIKKDNPIEALKNENL